MKPAAVPADAADQATVPLRPQPEVRRARRMSVRFQQTLAVALVLVLACAFLAWYYTHLGKTPRARPVRPNSQPAELILPPLPAAALAAAMAPAAPPPPATPAAPNAAPVPPARIEAPLPAAPLAPPVTPLVPDVLAVGPPAPRAVPAADTAESSPVLYHLANSTGPAVTPPAMAGNDHGDATAGPTLARLLSTTSAPAASATRTGSQTLLLPKGATVPCTLETAIDSQLPGLVTCRTSVDVYGADGQLVVLDRGTALLGEARSDVRPGQSRVFVLWTEARTPTGVTVPLASPATDALGRSGVPGAVDTHFFARFGAAILISVIDTAVQAAMTRSGGTTVIYSPQATEAILTEILRNTLAIPPTITVAPGARLQVLVARDLDFSDVYRLRTDP